MNSRQLRKLSELLGRVRQRLLTKDVDGAAYEMVRLRGFIDEMAEKSGCPNCGQPSMGQQAILMISRGTHETLPGVMCECGNVWVDMDRPEDEYGEEIEL